MQNMFLKKHQIFTFQWQGHWRELGVSRFFPSNSFFDGIKKPKGDTERCKAQAKSWAIVRVQVVSDYATEITRSRRMTFSDQLANLGEWLLTYYTLKTGFFLENLHTWARSNFEGGESKFLLQRGAREVGGSKKLPWERDKSSFPGRRVGRGKPWTMLKNCKRDSQCFFTFFRKKTDFLLNIIVFGIKGFKIFWLWLISGMG